MRPIVTASAVLAIALGACARPAGVSPELPCVGHLCTLTVQNNSGTSVTFRYVDSTGRREVLGLVAPLAVRKFGVRWVRSAGLRLYGVTRDQTSQADVALEATRAVDVHYPDDFTLTTDTLDFPPKR